MLNNKGCITIAMNRNIFTTEVLLRALGLLALLLVILASGTSIFSRLLDRQDLLFITVAAAILLGAAYYLRHKRVNTEQEEEQ